MEARSSDYTIVDGKEYPRHLSHDSYNRLMYDTFYRTYQVEWHCPGRHGVFRNIPRKETNLLSGAITFFQGRKGQWWKKSPGKSGFMDVEFVAMTKVYPPPREPWEWCGKSVLFDDMRRLDESTHRISDLFKIGQKVSFTHQGVKYTGLVCNKGKHRATILIPGRDLKWYVPFGELEMETD